MNPSEVILNPKLKPKEEAKPPSLYVVVLHNDNMTPRGFVILSLKQCFRKVEREAELLMMEAHEQGHAVVATFTKEIAEMKAQKANDFSSRHGYALLYSAEKERE